jgi:ubiquinone/menaquinone biosynthesis C-methylase UbiE
MKNFRYLMESSDEALRLDMKTDDKAVEKQALWAGIKPGMRVADLGCGSGKTTAVLHKLAQPGGEALGLDISSDRIAFANEHYKTSGLHFVEGDLLQPLTDIGSFDFIWIRFVLEYYLENSFDIVSNVVRCLKPGGILCLIDLDNNCLNHHDLPARLQRTLFATMEALQAKANFDPYVGKKLYSFLYDLGFADINVDVSGHHLIWGELKESDSFNWLKKIEIAPKKIDHQFEEYEGGYEEFLAECKTFFTDPRRFTYSPIISCRGVKPK